MLADIGIGLLLGILIPSAFGGQATTSLALLGVLIALTPDIDFLMSKVFQRNEVHHRNFLHIPLLVPLIFAGLWLSFGPMIATLASACLLWHFFHDSVGIGWGVRWLYPFSRDSYSFFYHIENPRENKTIRNRPLFIWKADELDTIAKRYGDPKWLKHIYGHAHPYALAELVTFALGVTVWLVAVL